MTEVLRTTQPGSTKVPPGPDALGLPDAALPWVAEAAAGPPLRTHDLLIRGSGMPRVAPGEAMPEPAGFRFDGAVMVTAPPGTPGLPRGAVPAPPVIAALALATAFGGRRRRC